MGNLQQYKARPYQKECLAEIAEAVNNGEKRALIVMASGLGKTITSAMAVEQFFANKPSFGHVLILCHSEQILSQSKDKFKDYFGEEYSYGLYAGKDKTTRQTDFLFATFQTMKEHRKEFGKDAFSYVIVDEAHHSHARTYFPTIRYFQPEFLIGLTATPDRLDGQNIEEIYGTPVYELGFIEAMSQGLLAECDYQLVLDDMSQEKLNECIQSKEKLSIAQLNRTVFVPQRDEEIIRLIRQYSVEQKDPKTIIFCKSIEHARRIAKLMGDESVLVHNGQSKLTNDMALEAFRQGKICTIVSVQMLNEGIDVPDANIIVFLRNTVSEAIFYQQLGRGTRLSPGKDKVKVLDFVANCERIQTILELKQSVDQFKGHSVDSNCACNPDANSREKFTLNIATPEFRAKTVDIMNLLEKVTNGREWMQERIIQGLQKMYRNGEKVTLKTVALNPGLPSPDAIRCAFGGSFNNALRAADIPINYEPSSMSRSEMITEGIAMHNRGEKITCGSIENNPKLPNRAKVRKEFGSIRKFAELCGEIIVAKNIPSRKDMLQQYWLASKKAGYWLKLIEVDKNTKLASMKRYQKEFGRRESLISEAQAQYGPIIDEASKMTAFHKMRELYAKQYYEVSAREGYWLRRCDLRKGNGLNSEKQYRKYFPNGLQELVDLAYELCGDLPDYREGKPKQTRPTASKLNANLTKIGN